MVKVQLLGVAFTIVYGKMQLLGVAFTIVYGKMKVTVGITCGLI